MECVSQLEIKVQQDSIPVGCIPPTCKPYLLQFQLPPPDVAPRGGGGPQMNKFEQVSSDHHQMSLGRGRSPGLMSRGRGGLRGGRSPGLISGEEGTYHVTYPMMYLMLRHLPRGQTPVKTLPSPKFVSAANNQNLTFPYYVICMHHPCLALPNIAYHYNNWMDMGISHLFVS